MQKSDKTIDAGGSFPPASEPNKEDGLLQLAAKTMDFWDNPIDDAVWGGPEPSGVRVIGRIGPDLRPLVPIVVQGANGQERKIPVLLSTGFQEVLLLPAADVAALGLPQTGTQAVTFPDGSQINATVHPAKILLAGEAVDVDILAGGHEPRMGLALLQDCRLSMRFTAGAAINIERL